MIFSLTYKLIERGIKTQTRRLWQPDWCLSESNDAVCVRDGKGRVKFRVGGTLAIQPARGQKASGRVRITGLRRESLQSISREDCFAEGVAGVDGWFYAFGDKESEIVSPHSPRQVIAQVWDSLHSRRGTRYGDDPEVLVIEFERTDAAGVDEAAQKGQAA